MTFAFFVKAVVGFGGPLLAVPMLAPFLGVEHAVVALSIGNVISNAMLLWGNRHGADATKALLVRVIGAGVIGVAVGSVLLTTLDDRILSGLLAASVFGYIALSLSRPELKMTHEQGRRVALPVGVVGGLLHGTTGNSGSVFGTYLHALGLPRPEFVFAVTIPFMVFGSVQIATLVSLGSFTGTRTFEALLAVIPIALVTPLGSRIGDRLPRETFSKLVLALLAFSGAALVVAALG